MQALFSINSGSYADYIEQHHMFMCVYDNQCGFLYMQKLISKYSLVHLICSRKQGGIIAAIWFLAYDLSYLPETNWKKERHFSFMIVVENRCLTPAVKLNFYQSNSYWFWHFASNMLTRGLAWWHSMIKKFILIIKSQKYCLSVHCMQIFLKIRASLFF